MCNRVSSELTFWGPELTGDRGELTENSGQMRPPPDALTLAKLRTEAKMPLPMTRIR
jgi:hypothetical protein